MATVVRASELLAAAKRNAHLGKKLCKMYKVPVSAIEGNTKDVACVCGTVVRHWFLPLLYQVHAATMVGTASWPAWVCVMMWCRQVKSGVAAGTNIVKHIRRCRPAQDVIAQQRGREGELWMLSQFGRPVSTAGRSETLAGMGAPVPVVAPMNALTATIERGPRQRQPAMDFHGLANMLVGMAINGTINFNATNDEHLK